jgi:hypothetical protein
VTAITVGSRSRERGATLFVVVLAITLLTGVGLYSLHSSALVARASGNQREARQTTYLAELGTLAMLSDTSQDPALYVTRARDASYPCKNNVGYETATAIPPSCFKKSSADYTIPTGAALMSPDSFGAYSDIAGRFHTELTDVGPGAWAIAGQQMSQDGFQFYQGKLTTVAQIERAGSGGVCVANMMPIAGQHVTRAHVVMGPLKLQ